MAEDDKTRKSAVEPADARKPYAKPVLRTLGTVRELTQGTKSTDGK
jgi:hypothetical protein